MKTSRRVKIMGKQSGFTLIELMITVAILAIVMAVAIPTYTNYVTQANRSEGKALVLNAAQALERCYTRFNAYNAAGCNIGLPLVSENGWYQITAASSTFGASTFSLVAVPQGTQATRDNLCGNFIVNERGQRDVGLSDSPAVIQECW